MRKGLTFLTSATVLLAALLGEAPRALADSGTSSGTSNRTVTVFAASSLTKAYTALGQKFMAGHSQITIKFAFGSSTTLAAQIAAGAPADIFAAADTSSMATVAAQFPAPVNYVTNQVVLALPKNSAITKFADLNGRVTWLQCGHSVPCGIAADSALKSEGVVTSSPVSLEASASSATAKLLAGAVDAAILFKTDVVANPTKLKYIPFTNPAAAMSQYQIGLAASKATTKNVWARTVYLYLSGLTAKKFLLASGFIA